MGDNSGSRYSIIATFCNTKMVLMDQRDSLQNALLEAEQDVELSKQNLKADKEAIMAEAKRRCDKVDREVKEKQFIVDNLRKGLVDKRTSINKKLEAIDSALKKLEDISKSSVAQS